MLGTESSADPELNQNEELIYMLREELSKHARSKILCDTVKWCVSDNQLAEPLSNKVHDIVTSHGVAQCVKLGSECALLGLGQPKEPPLTFLESQALKEAVADTIAATETDLDRQLRARTKNLECNSSINSPDIDVRDRAAMDMQGEVLVLVNTYRDKVEEHIRLLEEIRELRQGALVGTCEAKASEAQLRTDVNARKARMLSARVRTNVFTESDVALQAHKMIAADVTRRQERCAREIGELKESRDKYRLAACKEYDEVLRQYLQYSASLKRLEELHLKVRRKV